MNPGVRAYPVGATLACRRVNPPKRPAGPVAMARPHAPQDYPTTSRARPGPIVEVRAGPTAPCERSSSLLTMQRGRGDLVCGWRPRACLPLSSMRRGTRVPRPPSTSDLHYEPRSSASKRSASTGGSHEPPSPLNENAQCAGQRIREHAPRSPKPQSADASIPTAALSS